MPRVSVGITCYNEGKLLLEAFQTVLNQTFKNWECIIINDASPDKTTNEICQELSTHPKVRVIWRQQNGGLSASVNTGVSNAKTKVYVRLDGDDLLPPKTLELIDKAFEAHPEAGFVYGDYEAFGDWQYLYRPEGIPFGDIVHRQIFNGTSPFKKTTWEAVGGFAKELSYGMQDWDFWMSVIEAGFKGFYVGDTIYKYRAREASMARRRGPNYPTIYEFIYRKHKSFLNQYGVGKEFIGRGYARGAAFMYVQDEDRLARRWALEALKLGNYSRDNLRILLASCVREPTQRATRLLGRVSGRKRALVK